uniref:Amino acid transporter transmembrane domain-containing protein n=1 Tax=Gouania willdenowi TaxID=441366 RepID=A0A8C5E4L8_GOUWI
MCVSVTMSTNTDCYNERSGETEALLESDAARPRVGGASFSSSVFNLINAIMGSGILGLAYAMANTGIVGFCILLLLVSSLAAYSIHLLLTLCDQTGINSYEDLGGRALQHSGKVVVGLSILIQNIGAMASYLFILKSELPAAISSLLSPETGGHAWYENGRLLLIIVTLCVVLPLSLLPRIGFLGYTSSLAFFFMLYFAVVIVVKKWSIPCPLPQNVSSFQSAFAIPTMAFSFLCHTAILPIYCELDRPTKTRMQKVSNISICVSFLVYLISALFGYLTFYGHVDSELLLSYDTYLPRDIMVMTVRLAILLSVLLTVPLIHFPARKSLVLLLCGGQAFSWFIHITATLSILGVVLLMAIFVPDISNVFGVVGSTTSSCLLFIFPGIFYLKISDQPLRSVHAVGAFLLVVFGLMMGVISFSVIVITWATNS